MVRANLIEPINPANRTRILQPWAEYLVILLTCLALLLAMDAQRLFAGEQYFAGFIALETHYFYALLALLLPLSFLIFPALKSPNPPLWTYIIDLILMLTSFSVCVYFFIHADLILDEGWEFGAPEDALWACYLLWILALEATRRVAGLALFLLASLFSIYPIFAGDMPGPISGMSTTIADTAAYHATSIESLLGIPFRAFANLVIGFLLFGVALQRTGGGKFFIDIAFALLGHVRGGPAKVAVLSSGLMGSMSGSVITNVLTTGQLTIPAMKKSGFRADYAAGVEACASTGGVLLPPVMGSTAFIMATFLGVPYYQVALAGLIPALLYFVGLFIQIDAYAARHNLKGLPKHTLPKVRQTLAQGWFYLFAFVTLVVLLVVLQREAIAPYIATALLLILNQFSKQHRWKLADIGDFLLSTGKLLVEIVVILSGVGLIVGAMSMTGLAGTLVNELLFLAGGSVGLLLLMGAMTSFVLGIGMTVTAAYIFLAIILAPALIQGGLDPMSVHLFILYWGMLSFITPPVALGAFAAASIAGASPMRTGFTAMGLGSVIYFIPFFFVLDTGFILQGSLLHTLNLVVQALIGMWLIAGAMQGYLAWFGSNTSMLMRIPLGLAGVLIAMPGAQLLHPGFSDLAMVGVGGALLVFIFTAHRLLSKQAAKL